MRQRAESKHSEYKSGLFEEKLSSVLLNQNNSNDFSRRNLKWLTFSKPKVVSGFDNFAPGDVPIMSGKVRGISLCLERIVGWIIPFSQFKNVNPKEDEFTIQLSFSLFHFKSKSFFGSTWMGAPVILSDSHDMLPVVIDVDYNEVIYLLSRLTDPSCFGVVEIVVSKVNKDRQLVSAQYGYRQKNIYYLEILIRD
jgi:hypothetical protein